MDDRASLNTKHRPHRQTSVHRDIGATNVRGTDATSGTNLTVTTDAAHISAAATDPARIGATAHISTTDASAIGTTDATTISGVLFGEPATDTEHLGCQDPETTTEVGGA